MRGAEQHDGDAPRGRVRALVLKEHPWRAPRDPWEWRTTEFVQRHGGLQRLILRAHWRDLEELLDAAGASGPVCWFAEGAARRPPDAPPRWVRRRFELDGAQVEGWPLQAGEHARLRRGVFLPTWVWAPALLAAAASAMVLVLNPVGGWVQAAATWGFMSIALLALLAPAAIYLRIGDRFARWWLISSPSRAELVRVGPAGGEHRVPIDRHIMVVLPFTVYRRPSTADWILLLPRRPHAVLCRGFDPAGTVWEAALREAREAESRSVSSR